MWNRKRKNLLFMAVITAAALLLSACGKTELNANTASADAASSQESDLSFQAEKAVCASEKEETVTVKADAEGKPTKITVADRLKGTESGDFILDQTNLSNIRNTDGDEEFQLSEDGSLIWQSLGEDISYEGESDQELPVGVQISYYLNGKKVSAEEIAGASGEVRVRFDYSNTKRVEVTRDGEDKSLLMPYLFMTMALLPSDSFTDLQVENGKVMEMSGKELIVGYAVPGFMESLKLNDWEVTEDMELPEYVEFSGHTENFGLEFTATMVTDGLFEEIEEEDLSDLDELTDKMEELSDASSQIADGGSQLADGGDLFGIYLSQYTSGVDTAMSTMVMTLDTINTQVSAAMTASQSQLAGASEALTALASDAAKISELLQAEESAIDELDEASSNLSSAETALNSLLSAHPEISAEEAAELQTALSDASSSITAAKEGLLNTENIESIQAAAEDMQTQMQSLSALTGRSDTDTGSQSTEGTTSTSLFTEEQWAELTGGVQTLLSAGEELNTAYASLNEGMYSLADGLEEFDREAISKLTELAGSDLQELLKNIRAEIEADGQDMTFSGRAEGTKTNVRYVIQTEEVS